MKNVRLKDIAKRLDLTKVSVSKALRDHSDISEETKKRVKEMAQKMGYRPNLVARSLTSKKSQTVGVIVPKIAHSFFSSVIEGIYQAALESEYEVILGVSMEDDKLERKHIESMLDMRVEGLLISVSEKTGSVENFDLVKGMDTQLVFFDRGFTGSDYTYLKVEDRGGARKGVRHMTEQGYEKIAHLSGYLSVEIGKDRRLGYEEAMSAAGLEVDRNAIVEAGFSEDDGYKGFAKLMEQYGKPEAVFCATYPVGLGALQYMKDHDMDPAEIAILAFGSSEFNQYLAHPFICIDQSTFEMGYSAFERLIMEIESEDGVPPELISLQTRILNKEDMV
ncbi:transcriptional regulator, LacI family [Fodinibius roseus]|uniref:Transcriptional regulator, LacI family n=1 Tax=Fodinibius roseus TaxID=1194090 RepID=A0A1M4VQT7_9BACT|nr:LacI family DNA-binding transcriptional regulator [Fodinibius roseus]SHE71471.1 transcriptional regulator, LacI family [Fodinibius roseus]